MTDCLDEQRTYRKMITIPADEVERGDVICDSGRFKLVEHAEPGLVELSVILHFEPPDESGTLRVKSLQSVSVWRVCPEVAS